MTKSPAASPPPPAPVAAVAPAPAPAEPRVSGVLTRRAFEMFERNETRARVAMDLGEPVENVNWLFEQ